MAIRLQSSKPLNRAFGKIGFVALIQPVQWWYSPSIETLYFKRLYTWICVNLALCEVHVWMLWEAHQGQNYSNLLCGATKQSNLIDTEEALDDNLLINCPFQIPIAKVKCLAAPYIGVYYCIKPIPIYPWYSWSHLSKGIVSANNPMWRFVY